MRRGLRFLPTGVAAGTLVLVALSLPCAALATTVTIEGPLGTTVATPPLELGAPGQPGPLDGTSVGAAGVAVSAGEGNAGAPPPSAPSGNPTPATPANTAPGQQAPAQQTAPTSPSAGSQPAGERGSQPSNQARGRTRTGGNRSSNATGSARSESGGGASPTGRGATDRRVTPAAGESTGDRPRRRSVADRIVDRVPPEYRFGLLSVAAIAFGFAIATARERRRAKRAESEALVDPLTGLANRRAFDRQLTDEWLRSERYEHPLGLVMLDLDGFKQINDTRGHKEGDRILRETAALISARLRATDLAVRLGGDEFAALCPETPSEGLEALTHSLERCLEALPVGASIGFAEREPTDEGPSDLFARADAAMYREKQGHGEARPLVRT